MTSNDRDRFPVVRNPLPPTTRFGIQAPRVLKGLGRIELVNKSSDDAHSVLNNRVIYEEIHLLKY
jgi:hypothetical protein